MPEDAATLLEKLNSLITDYVHLDLNKLYKYVEPVLSIEEKSAGPYAITNVGMGLEIAEKILQCSKVAEDTLAAGIIFPTVYYCNLSTKKVNETFAPEIAKAVRGVMKMDMVPMAATNQPRFRQSLDNMRKLMLAMVDDFRIVLIKLAERLVVLTHLRDLPEPARLPIALEVQRVYAPLANRMGIGHLKWQLEDLAFRYMDGQEYKRLSQGLKHKRVERETYISNVIAQCTQMLQDAGIEHFTVTGRAKHIYSIYKKLQRKKQKEVSDLFDTSAVRILVDTKEECYNVLSLVNHVWKSIPEEFDDYIHAPKPNGYQSIHSAVWGPEDHCVEIQIRTYDMHEAAEGGVASHWSYKESAAQESSYQQKIDALRNLMNWQSGLVEEDGQADAAFCELFSDRAYVFTPNGDVVDLPAKATPLDFAYHIHTELGHKCRGAHVNHKLVALNHPLQTGDIVEITTAKNGEPSRDWLDVQKKYLVSSKARAKVAHYFKHQDFAQNITEGKAILEKFMRKHELKRDDIINGLDALRLQTFDELLVALATGAVGTTTLLHKLRGVPEQTDELAFLNKTTDNKNIGKHAVIVDGLGATETLMAQCCRPIPGDPIVGYVAHERGVVIHHRDCTNLLHAMQRSPDRVLAVRWNAKGGCFVADLQILIHDRPAAISDIVHVISSAKLNILDMQAHVQKGKGTALVDVSVEVVDVEQLEAIMRCLSQMPVVDSVRRK